VIGDLPAWLLERPAEVSTEFWELARAVYRSERERLGREPSQKEVMDANAAEAAAAVNRALCGVRK
jgi:hypothetical protein